MFLRELELLLLEVGLTIQDRAPSLRAVQHVPLRQVYENADSAQINARRTVVGPPLDVV